MTSMRWSENRPANSGQVLQKKKKKTLSRSNCECWPLHRHLLAARCSNLAPPWCCARRCWCSGPLRDTESSAHWGKVTKGQFRCPLPTPPHTPGPSWPPPCRPSAWPDALGRWRRQQTAAPQSSPAAPSSGSPGRCWRPSVEQRAGGTRRLIRQHLPSSSASPTIICLGGMKSALWRTRSKILASWGLMKASSERTLRKDEKNSQSVNAGH